MVICKRLAPVGHGGFGLKSNDILFHTLLVCRCNLMKDIKSRKLKYFGHVKRHQNILKSVLERVMRAEDAEDDSAVSGVTTYVKGWTGRRVTAQNRTEWRSIVANLRTEDSTKLIEM